MDILSLTPAPEPVPLLNGAAPRDNLISDLTFCITQILSPIATPEQCYLPDGHALIRACAGALPSEIEALIPKLAAKFGKDWRVQRFRANIREAKAELTVKTPGAGDGLLCSENGTPKPILANAITKLTASAIQVAFDSFADRVVIQGTTPWASEGHWTNHDDGETTNYLQHEGITVKSDTTNEAIYVIAKRKKYHPVKDWLTAAHAAWDGQVRLKHLFGWYFGAIKNGVYEAEVSRMWAISCVARIFDPGCMSKYMVVLEGLQDDGKSKGLRALANGHLNGKGGYQWYRDRMPKLEHVRGQEIGQFLQGVWIIEIAELAGFQRSEQEDVKSFISTQTDTFRSPYGRNIQDYPRQCVFAGTVNVNRDATPDWGKDPTGLVRFWPIRVGKPIISDPNGGPCILRDHAQIWGEAVDRYRRGELWYPDPDDDSFNKLARAEQEDRMPEDVHMEGVLRVIEKSLAEFITMEDVCREFGYGMRERKSFGPEIGRCLAKLGWVRRHRRNVAGGYAYEKE